ncbi:MAG: hypothetical protein V1745_01895 [Patescibacteria group bacterium]
MSIKRRTTTTKAPRRRPARPSTAASADMAPRILSPEEKHELILAHAEARHPSDPVQRFSMWAGVAICIAFVAVAWFSTIGSGIRSSLAGSMDPAVKRALDEGRKLMDDVRAPALQETLQDVTQKLEAATAQEAIVDELASVLSATGTSDETSTRADLFRPAPDLPSTTTTDITTSTTP